jgi:hypothetical protein
MKSTDCAPINSEDDELTPETEERNLGLQPMDELLTTQGLTNHDIVAASRLPMTHKAVQRARKGRKLTQRMQLRMVTAVNAALKGRDSEHVELNLDQLFSYKA